MAIQAHTDTAEGEELKVPAIEIAPISNSTSPPAPASNQQQEKLKSKSQINLGGEPGEQKDIAPDTKKEPSEETQIQDIVSRKRSAIESLKKEQHSKIAKLENDELLLTSMRDLRTEIDQLKVERSATNTKLDVLIEKATKAATAPDITKTVYSEVIEPKPFTPFLQRSKFIPF